MTYELTVGLEIHVELDTESKAFCACPNRFGAAPNTLICPVCAGFPGALPVLNESVVERAVRVGKAFGCTINMVSRHDRKNYYYPDLPNAYQITQQRVPILSGGAFFLYEEGGLSSVALDHIHMEEDAGKLLHGAGDDYTRIDFNRAGVPLLEIVTQPCLHTPERAQAFLEALRQTLVELEVTDGKMHEGSIRCDVNVSVGSGAQMGVKVELKNIGTFSGVRRAIAFEFKRQTRLLEKGDPVVSETRRWDDMAGMTLAMREKESLQDYRFFFEPNLQPTVVLQELCDRVIVAELPQARLLRYVREFSLPPAEAALLCVRPRWAYFEACLVCGAPPRAAANWICGELARLSGGNVDALPPERLCQLIRCVEQGAVSSSAGKAALAAMLEFGWTANRAIGELGLDQMRDNDALSALAAQIVADHPQPAAAYRAGKTNALDFLVGRGMKASGGRADPAALRALLKSALECCSLSKNHEFFDKAGAGSRLCEDAQRNASPE